MVHRRSVIFATALFNFLLCASALVAANTQTKYVKIFAGQRVGLADAFGKTIIPPVYENLGWSDDTTQPTAGVIGYREDSQWGLMTIDQKKITKPVYSSLLPLDEQQLKAGKRLSPESAELVGIITPRGQVKISLQYHTIAPIKEYYLVSSNVNGREMFGMINQKEHTIIPSTFKDITIINQQLIGVKNFNERIALFDKSGKALTAFYIDKIEDPVHAKLYPFWTNGFKGLFDDVGTIIIEPAYKSLALLPNNTVSVGTYGNWQLANADKSYSYTISGDTVLPVTSNMFIVQRGDFQMLFSANGKPIDDKVYNGISEKMEFLLLRRGSHYGLATWQGKELLPLDFEEIIVEDRFVFAKISEWSLFNHLGRKLSSETWEAIQSLGDGRFAMKRNGKWGFLNNDGQVQIEPQFDSLLSLRSDRCVAMQQGKFGVIDANGQWLVPPKYGPIEIIHKNLFLAHDDKNHLINGQGQIIYSSEHELAPHELGVLETAANGKVGLLDNYLFRILKTGYDQISPVQMDRYYILQRDGKYSLVDRLGRTIIAENQHLQQLLPFEDEFIGFKKGNKYGYVDINGTLRIANQYEGVGKWREDRGPVKIMGKWGFVDRQEKLVVQPHYDEVLPFRKGVSIVKQADKFGLVNAQGKEVLPVVYDRIVSDSEGNYLITRNGKRGMANATGRLAIQAVHDDVISLGDGYFGISNAGKSGIKNAQNIDILPLVFEKVSYDPANKIILGCKEGESTMLRLP